MSTVGDIMSTVGVIMSTVGVILSTVEGVFSTVGDIMSTVEGGYFYLRTFAKEISVTKRSLHHRLTTLKLLVCTVHCQWQQVPNSDSRHPV